jgi:hypothetical protein
MPKIQLLHFTDTGIFLMNSHTQIQNTLNHPPLQPYSPNLNPPIQTHRLNRLKSELEPNVTDRIRNHENQSPVAKRLANTKQMNYQQWLEVENRALAAVMQQPPVD